MTNLVSPECYKRPYPALLLMAVLGIMCACTTDKPGDPLFRKLPSHTTRISFQNTLTETDTFNYFLFSYMYMGGGVSVADFNNDGLTDIYFTGNMVPNRLYLNRGNFRFEDATSTSQTGAEGRWKLGSTVCDINDDGWADIYVSVSGLTGNCHNMLFVNQGCQPGGIPVFKEEAAAYGIDDDGKSTQGTFFDYDNDGDQDLYVANYPITQFKSPPYFYRQMMNHANNAESGHLYRNNGVGTFTNVTEEAGLLNFGLSLSATVSDLNQDGYLDIYISNDFTSPDFYYFNNGNGTFTDRTRGVTGQTSFYGMGADIADYNNDGLPDIMQIDMAPEDNQRAKENMSTMSAADFSEMVTQGLHYQYRYSTLQLNRGVRENGLPLFSNTAWLAGVTSTDWSWAALFADFDLDGWKDLFITNGSRRDINNIDYFNKMQTSGYFGGGPDKSQLLRLIHDMPSKALPNYMYRNNRDLTFTHCSKAWGLTENTFSNGTAYADLDNDGDLELIVSNIDQKALVYRNMAREMNTGGYLKVDFKGPAGNRMGLGCRVTLFTGGTMQMAELTLSRGYQSSVEPVLYFGTGNYTHIDSLTVRWPDGRQETKRNTETNRNLTLDYKNAVPASARINPATKKFTEITASVSIGFVHKENESNDYEKQPLLPYKLSATGPYIAVGDINNDGQDDFFVGNALHSRPALFTQRNGVFGRIAGPWENHTADDAGCLFFDADADGDSDLYVVSGGNEFPASSPQYNDRLYMNTGKGAFAEATEALPKLASSGSCVIPVDFDRDGRVDLFVGERQVPGNYPMPASGHLLKNMSANGKVKFEDVTAAVAPELLNLGMITAAFSADLNADGWPELVVAGEWMPVCIFENSHGKFSKTTLKGTAGWWFSITGADVDHDGDVDLVAGNYGLNSRYNTGAGKTFDVYAGDFDADGKYDIDLAFYQGEHQYPLRSRSCYLTQHPGFASQFPTFESFAKAEMKDLYPAQVLASALHLQVETFASCYFENNGKGAFVKKELPPEAQLSAIQSIVIEDIDGDGNPDILAAGNLFDTEITTPRNDGGAGIWLKGDGHGNFTAVSPAVSGFFANRDVRSMALIRLNNKEKDKAILVGNNNDSLQVFKMTAGLKN